MLTLILAAAVAQIDYAASAKTPTTRPTVTTAITALPASNPVQAPPPIVVQFHEDAATKDDIRSLGDRIDAVIKPVDTRLAAVERRTESLAADVAVLKASRQPAPVKTAVTATQQKLYLTDAEGIRCWGWDEAELRGRVAQRNAAFAARSTRIAAPAYVQAPQYYAAPPINFGGYNVQPARSSCELTGSCGGFR